MVQVCELFSCGQIPNLRVAKGNGEVGGFAVG